MFLPFDIRPDRAGWTVFEVTTGTPADVSDVFLVGLPLEDAEEAVNALNALELRCLEEASRIVREQAALDRRAHRA